jgi:outer membrane immunogenic protein
MGTKMKLLSGILGLTLTSAVALASANAADMYRAPAGGGFKDGPYVPVASWTGFYVGINGGYAWDASAIGFDNNSGGFGGGQIGYNWQGFSHPNLVIGVEADFQGADIGDKLSGTVLRVPASAETNLNYFGTVRGRIGYAADRTLVYATGGLAFGQVEDKLTVGQGAFTETTTRTGWVVGGGLEHKLTPNWSVKGEYQYINLGQDDGWAKATAEDYTIHTVRLGLNYQIGHSYEPLK